MRLLPIVSLLFSVAPVAAEEVLQNDFIQVTVDPGHGGAVTAMAYKKAASLPFIAERGAGVAGSGRFFTPVVTVGDQVRDLASTPMTVASRGTDQGGKSLVLRADLSAVSPGLWLERSISVGHEDSGLHIRDSYRNDGPGARAVTLRVGAASRQQPEPWRLTLRCWFGDAQRGPWKFTPYAAGDRETMETKSPQVFWRVIGQYGTGFLCQVTAPQAPVSLTHSLPKEKGNPAEFQWLAGATALGSGKVLTAESAILIDEGGRQSNHPSGLLTPGQYIVTADICAAGKTGELMRGFGTVVSLRPRKVKMIASQFYQGAEKERTKVAELDLVLEAGRAESRQFEFRPMKPGLFHAEIVVLNQEGQKLAASSARAIIDGEGQDGEFGAVWKKYTTKLPEVHARGTWAEIGAQLAKSGNPGPFKAKGAAGEDAAKRLAFYEKHFPFYADMLKGAAKALEVKPELLALAARDEAGPHEGCMGVFFNGPDGPINAYSKERSGSALSGLGYVKVLPDKGYPYHMYTLGNWSFGYGINAEGLCTSGASINCDARTEAAGNKATQDWKQAGKMTAPLGTHLMLATCKDVDEALAFIRNPLAPFEFTGNMLLVDRAGNAAILESVGIFHQVYRPAGKGVFATGNYPHENKDGLFQCGSNWGWGTNTMLRERFLDRVLAEKKGQVSLKDAFTIMETHALPGGMCQHTFENPGLLYSSTSYLAVARTGELHISAGPPCLVRYQRYTLKDER